MELPSALYKAKLEYGKAFLLTPALLQVLDKYCAFHEVPEARYILNCMIDSHYLNNMVSLGYKVQDCESQINRLHLVNGYNVINVRYVYDSLAYALGQKKDKPMLKTTAGFQEEAETGMDYQAFRMISDTACEVWDAFVAAISQPETMFPLMFNLYFSNLSKKTPDISEYERDLKMLLLSDVKSCIRLATGNINVDISELSGLAFFIVASKIFEPKKTILYDEIEDYIKKYGKDIQSICDQTELYCMGKIKYKKTGDYYFSELLGAQIVPQQLLENYENSINKLRQKVRIYGKQ